MRRAVLIALLLLIGEPILGPWWTGVGLLTWASVRAGLRASLNLQRDLWRRRVRARLRREVLAADAERAAGAADLVAPRSLPFRIEKVRN